MEMISNCTSLSSKVNIYNLLDRIKAQQMHRFCSRNKEPHLCPDFVLRHQGLRSLNQKAESPFPFHARCTVRAIVTFQDGFHGHLDREVFQFRWKEVNYANLSPVADILERELVGDSPRNRVDVRFT